MTLQIRCGCEGGGKGALVQEDKSATLSTHNVQTLFQPIPIADHVTRSKKANGFGIGNPGDPANTLTSADRHGVAYCIDKATWNSGKGSTAGIGITEDYSPTITATHHPPAIAYDCRNDRVNIEISGTLQAKENGGQSLNYVNPVIVPEKSGAMTAKMAKGTGGPAGDECQNLCALVYYVIRKFTPLECGRLQGFPDWWTEGLAIENPSEGIVQRWMKIFREHWEVVTSKNGTKQPKTENQARKWLKSPDSDSAIYKMWGNGIALPCAMYVMEGIAEILNQESEEE